MKALLNPARKHCLEPFLKSDFEPVFDLCHDHIQNSILNIVLNTRKSTFGPLFELRLKFVPCLKAFSGRTHEIFLHFRLQTYLDPRPNQPQTSSTRPIEVQ